MNISGMGAVSVYLVPAGSRASCSLNHVRFFEGLVQLAIQSEGATKASFRRLRNVKYTKCLILQ